MMLPRKHGAAGRSPRCVWSRLSGRRSMISRRGVLKGVGVAGLGAAGLSLATPAVSQGATKVTFTTSWIPEGPNLFAYVARDKGFWKKAGLDADRHRPGGQEIADHLHRPDQLRRAHGDWAVGGFADQEAKGPRRQET